MATISQPERATLERAIAQFSGRTGFALSAPTRTGPITVAEPHIATPS